MTETIDPAATGDPGESAREVHRAFVARGVGFWDKRAAAYDAAVRKHDARYDERIASIASLIGPTGVVLDLGCASGEIAVDLAPHVGHVHGIDVAGEMIELANRKARALGLHNVAFSHMDVFDERLAAGSFTAVVGFYVFHLLQDATAVVRRLHELLAPTGLLISETPCLAERHLLFRSLIRLAVAIGYAPTILELTASAVESLAAGAHFEILESARLDGKDAVQRIVARKI